MAEDIHPQSTDSEEDVCRVCRGAEDEEFGHFVHPCKCSGSVKFVHESCLKQWVANAEKKQCEICGHKYAFAKVYPESLPAHIPITVYLRQGTYWVGRQVQLFFRAWLVVIAWLVILPAVSMSALRSTVYFTDIIGLPGPEALEAMATNGTDIDFGSERNGSNMLVTGVWLVDLVVGPLPAVYRLSRRSIRNWMQGDPDTAVGFVLRGQILAISLAAVIVGLILLREWVTQHNWNEEINPPHPLEDDIVPDDWLIVDGRALRFSERIAAILDEARAFVPGRAPDGPANPSDDPLDSDPVAAALITLLVQRGADFSHDEWVIYMETAQHLTAQGNSIAKVIVNQAKKNGTYPYNPPQEDAYPSQAAFDDALADFQNVYVEKMRKLGAGWSAAVAKMRRDVAQTEQVQTEAAQQEEDAEVAAAEVADEGGAGVDAPDIRPPERETANLLEAAFVAAVDLDGLNDLDPTLHDVPIRDALLGTPGNAPADAAPALDAGNNPRRQYHIPQTLPGHGPGDQDEDGLAVRRLWDELADRAGNIPNGALGPYNLQEVANGSPFPQGVLFTEQPNLVYERRQRSEDDAQEPTEQLDGDPIGYHRHETAYPDDMRELLPPWEREELERADARRREAAPGIMDELVQYRAMHARREQAGVDANGAGPSNSGAAQPERPGRNGYGSPPGDMAYVAPELLADAGAPGYRGALGNAGAGGAQGEGTGEGREDGQEGEDDYEVLETRRTLPLYPEPQGWGPERDHERREVQTDPGLPHGPHVQDYPMPPNFVRFPDDEWEDEADGGDGDEQLPLEGEGEAGMVQFEPNQEVLQRLQADGRLVAVDFVEEDGDLEVDDAWDPEDLHQMLDVIGFTGPFSGLFQNVIFGCMVMVAASGILIGMPMVLGKIFLSVDLIRTALMVTLRTLRLVKKITGPVVDVVLEIIKDVLLLPALASFKALERIVLKKLGMSVWEVNRFGGFAAVNKASSGGFPLPAPIAALLARVPPSLRPDELLAALGQSSLDEYDKYIARNRAWATSGTMGGRAGCVLAGYGSMLGTVLLIALGGEAGFGDTAGMLAGVIKQNVTSIKVAFFMILELAVFPLGVGFMIDFCTVPVFPNATILGRLEHLAAAPFGTVFVNWLQGTMFMFFFANVLSHIRQMCRPGTMFFIRDPADPNFSPVKDIMEKSTLHQMRKLGTSAVMYSVVIFMLFGAASWGLAYQPFWNILPLRMEPAFGPLTSEPFDYLFLHLIVPPTFDMLRPRHRARKYLSSLWHFAVKKLRLATLMELDVNADKAVQPPGNAETLFWKSADVVCQILFGKYDSRSSNMRVPANDSVALLPLPQRRLEGGVFVPLTAHGRPRTSADKLRLLKQDKVAREAGRNPDADYTVVRVPQWWRTRINVLIMCCLLVASGVATGGVVGPVLVGRMLWTFFDVEVHDGYAWFAGVYVLYVSLDLGRRARKYISTMDRASRLRNSIASRRAKRAALKFAAGVYGVAMVYGVLPVLTGIVFEIALGMFRTEVPVERVRVIHVWDVWANGLAMWSLAVGLGSVLHRAHLHWIDPIRTCFREPAAHEFRVTTNATWGPIKILSGLIVAPYIIYILIALISGESEPDEPSSSKFFHHTIPMFIITFMISVPHSLFASQFAAIRQKMVDAEYVVEEKVENYVPTPEKKGKPGSNTSKPGSHWVGPAHRPPNGNGHVHAEHAPAPVRGGGVLGEGLADGDDDIVQAWREYRAGVIQDELRHALDEVDEEEDVDGGDWEDI